VKGRWDEFCYRSAREKSANKRMRDNTFNIDVGIWDVGNLTS